MILHRYIGLRFLAAFAAVFGLFFLMIAFFDLIEQARRFSDDAAGFGQILTLALLSAPSTVYNILPLIAVIAAMVLFLGLARSSELVIARAAGRSALVTIMAPVAGALLLGCLAVAVMNPLVAATSRELEQRISAIRGETLAQGLAEGGIWLRQGMPTGQAVIRADRANLDGTALTGVSVLTFGADGAPQQRFEAATAELLPGAWMLGTVKVWPLAGTLNPERAAERMDSYRLPSALTADQIRDSFGTPSSIPVWDLPRFIDRLQAAGFTARRHQVFLQRELALPAVLAAMVLVGAAFTMRHQRSGRTGILVLAAILVAFGVYVLRNVAGVLGEAGDIAPALAAWVPPLAAGLLALALILHLEDG